MLVLFVHLLRRSLFCTHHWRKEPKGQQTHKKVTSMLASLLPCLVFLLICEVSSMFVLAILRSQKDNNKHSYAILLFLTFLGNQMEQQKIVLYTMFVEFFGKHTKLQKLVLYTLGFWHFREPNGTTKTCLIYLVFFRGWGKVPTSKLEFKWWRTWLETKRLGVKWVVSVHFLLYVSTISWH
jgi:hypothetical protein